MQEPQSLTDFNGRPRTNKAVEGWNSNFLKLLNGNHPSFPKLIEKFQDEQKNAEILIKKCVPGKECHVIKNLFMSNLTKTFAN